MAGFDDDKHPRDDKGRFSGGGRALDAWGKDRLKTTTGVKEKYKPEGAKRAKASERAVAIEKLIGYSKADGPAKGKVEGRARDIEVPLARKNEGYIASSSADVQDVTGEFSDVMGMSYRAPSVYRHMRDTENTLTDARERLEKEGLRAQKACEKITKANFDYREEDEFGRPSIKADAPPKLRTAWEKAAGKRDAVFQKLAQAEDALSAHRVITRGVHEFIGKKLMPGDKIEFSRSPDQGWAQIHVTSPSKDPDFPGEKEFSLDVEPHKSKVGSIGSTGVSWAVGEPRQDPSGRKWHVRSSMASNNPTITVTTQYPIDKRGKDHPNSKETSGKSGMLAQSYFPDDVRSHIKSFFDDAPVRSESERAADKFAEEHPQGVGIEKSGGGGKPGEIWKPGKKTIGDY